MLERNLLREGVLSEDFEGKISSLVVGADEIHVNIYCRNNNKPTAENEQFFSVKIQSTSSLYRELKKKKKSWGR